MADGYWRYNDARQQSMASVPLKRPRSDYDIPGGHELPSYFSREEERAGYRMGGETDSIGASYDRYLRSGQMSSFGGGGGGAGEPGRSLGGGFPSHHVDDMRMTGGRGYDAMASKGQSLGISSGKPEMPLPSDASNTLFVEGLPANCTRREVSHIFRPFVGFKEVRLVSKEARHSGGDPLVLCFVDFSTPAQAATAMDALQGEHRMSTLLPVHGKLTTVFICELFLLLLIAVFNYLSCRGSHNNLTTFDMFAIFRWLPTPLLLWQSLAIHQSNCLSSDAWQLCWDMAGKIAKIHGYFVYQDMKYPKLLG